MRAYPCAWEAHPTVHRFRVPRKIINFSYASAPRPGHDDGRPAHPQVLRPAAIFRIACFGIHPPLAAVSAPFASPDPPLVDAAVHRSTNRAASFRLDGAGPSGLCSLRQRMRWIDETEMVLSETDSRVPLPERGGQREGLSIGMFDVDMCRRVVALCDAGALAVDQFSDERIA